MTRSRSLLTLGIIGIAIIFFALTPASQAAANGVIPQTDEAISETPFAPDGETGGAELDFTGCTRVNVPAQNAGFEQRVVELVNLERAKKGLPPLKRNSELDYAARYHARDMVEDDYFSHDTFDRVNGGLVWKCGPFERIRLYYTGYSKAGENAAAGYATPEDVVGGWMNSPGHRANILDPAYREIGVGYYYGNATYRHYWVQDFGGIPSVYPVVVNNEAAVTTSPDVLAYLYGKDVWDEVRLRTNGDAWSNWMTFQELVNWQLAPYNGTQTLSVEFRESGQGGAAATSSDTITLTGIVMDYDYSVYLPLIIR